MAKPYPKMTIELESLARRAARLAEEFATTAGTHDRASSFPHANFIRLAQEGLLALNVPRRFGGRAGGLEDAVTVIRSLAQGEPSTALVLAMHYIHLATAARSWPASWAERLSREAANEVSLINALRVEPELGTPARGGLPATLARRTATGWSLSGHKIYSTGIPILSWLAVWARTDGPEPKVGTFLVPAKAAGIRVVETWDHLGMRATASHDVILEDVEVPHDHAVDVRLPKQWSRPDTAQMGWATLLVAGLYDGIARSARDWLVDFHVRFDFADALRGCKLLEELEPYLVEDPVRSEQFLQDIPKLRQMTTVPLAAGEEWGARWDFHKLVEAHDIDYIRATLPNVGGITEMLKIAAMCETHFVGIVPHFTGPLSTAALVHVLGVYSGPVLFEYNYGSRTIPHMPVCVDFKNGKLWPNDRPGLGVELDMKQLKMISEVTQPVTNRAQTYFRPDGSITNW